MFTPRFRGPGDSDAALPGNDVTAVTVPARPDLHVRRQPRLRPVLAP